MAIGTTAAILAATALSVGTQVAGGVMKKKAVTKSAEIQAEQARRSGTEVADAEAGTRGAIFDAANNAGAGVTNAAAGAGKNVLDASQTANALLDPYRVTGEEANAQLRNLLAPGGDLSRAPTLEDLQIDPGYAFRLTQGQKALEQSAAAKGGALSGAIGILTIR